MLKKYNSNNLTDVQKVTQKIAIFYLKIDILDQNRVFFLKKQYFGAISVNIYHLERDSTDSFSLYSQEPFLIVVLWNIYHFK